MTAVQKYLGIITDNEIQDIQKATPRGESHPLLALALSNPKNQVAHNTEIAAQLIEQKNAAWLTSIKARLLDTTKRSNSSSALGELRAHGALLETWMTVVPEPAVPGKRVVPEFEVDAGDGKVIVEVHSRQLDNAELETLKQHRDDLNQRADAAKTSGGAIVTGITEITPFGAPNPNKPGDSIHTNAVSRIAAIKKEEKQIDPNKPFVLWLDLQDPTVWGYMTIAEEQMAPLYTEARGGSVGSGALWFALYGRKDDVMIESWGYSYKKIEMLHDGRFYQTIRDHGGPTRISAVVYSLPRATVLMENPSPALGLPPRFRASLLKAPFFRLDLSICEWSSGLVKARVDQERKVVEATAEALSNFNF